jgi:hypothetical protein
VKKDYDRLDPKTERYNASEAHERFMFQEHDWPRIKTKMDKGLSISSNDYASAQFYATDEIFKTIKRYHTLFIENKADAKDASMLAGEKEIPEKRKQLILRRTNKASQGSQILLMVKNKQVKKFWENVYADWLWSEFGIGNEDEKRPFSLEEALAMNEKDGDDDYLVIYKKETKNTTSNTDQFPTNNIPTEGQGDEVITKELPAVAEEFPTNLNSDPQENHDAEQLNTVSDLTTTTQLSNGQDQTISATDISTTTNAVVASPQINLPKPLDHWPSLTPYQLVTELGYNWSEVKTRYRKKNPGIDDTELNKWIKKAIIEGWRLGDEPKDCREIKIAFNIDKNRYEIEAWFYEDAVTAARKLGLLETDTFDWKRKLSGETEHHGLRLAEPEDWWNFEHVTLTVELISQLGLVAENDPLAIQVAQITPNPTLSPIFSMLVRQAQEKIYFDDLSKVTGKLDPQTQIDLRLQFEVAMRKKEYEYEQSFVPEKSNKKAFPNQQNFELYYGRIRQQTAYTGGGEFGATLEVYAKTRKDMFANGLLAMTQAEKDLYQTLQMYDAELELERQSKIDPRIKANPSRLLQLKTQITSLQKIRYTEIDALIKEQQNIIDEADNDADRNAAIVRRNRFMRMKEPLLEKDPALVSKKMQAQIQQDIQADQDFQTARDLMPDNISAQTAFDIYYITLLDEYIDLGVKLGYLSEGGYDDTNVGEKVSAMLRSTFTELDPDEQRFLDLHFKIQYTKSAFLFNENPLVLKPESSFGDVFLQSVGTSYMGELATNMFATDVTTAQMIQSSVGNAGIGNAEMTDGANSTITEKAKGYEAFSANDWATTLGASFGMLTQMVGAGGAMKLGLKAMQLSRIGLLLSAINQSRKLYFNVYKGARLLASARVVKWIYAGLKSGALYEVTGRIFINAQEELNFWAGLLGGLGGDFAKGLFFKIFGKAANKAIAKIVELQGKAVGEVTEESIQALVQIQRESEGFTDMMNTIGEMFKTPPGGYSDAFKLFVQSYTMGLAFGSGSSLAAGMMKYAQKVQSQLTGEELSIAEQYVQELNEAYMLAMTAAVTDEVSAETGPQHTIADASYDPIAQPDQVTTFNAQEVLQRYRQLQAQGVTEIISGENRIAIADLIATLESNDLNGFKKLFGLDITQLPDSLPAFPNLTVRYIYDAESQMEGMLDAESVITLNLASNNIADATLEEQAHLWLELADRHSPTLIDGLLDQVQQTEAYRQLAANPNYSRAADQSPDRVRYLVKEVLAQAVRTDGANLQTDANTTQPGWFASFVTQFWNTVKAVLRALGVPVSDRADLSLMTAGELAALIRTELTIGGGLSNATSQQVLDFLEGRTDTLHIENSVLAGQEATGSVTVVNWYAMTDSQAKARIRQVAEKMMQKKELDLNQGQDVFETTLRNKKPEFDALDKSFFEDVYNELTQSKNENTFEPTYLSTYETVQISENYIGRGGEKQVFQIVNDSEHVLAFRLDNDLNAMKREMEVLSRLKALGFPVLEVAGITMHNGRPAMVMKKYAQGSKDVAKLVGKDVLRMGDSKYLNQKSIQDLIAIRKLMLSNKIWINDIQFLIAEDGSIVLADIRDVEVGRDPSIQNLDMIEMLITASVENELLVSTPKNVNLTVEEILSHNKLTLALYSKELKMAISNLIKNGKVKKTGTNTYMFI